MLHVSSSVSSTLSPTCGFETLETYDIRKGGVAGGGKMKDEEGPGSWWLRTVTVRALPQRQNSWEMSTTVVSLCCQLD